MPIGTGTAGEDFTVRVIMKAPGIIPQFWANTWEMSSVLGSTSDVDWSTFAFNLATFHAGMLMSPFIVDRVVVSTLATDSEPYDVTKLGVFEVNLEGARGAAGDIVPLWNCVLVKKVVLPGRLGNLLLRGFLTEGDLNSPGGVPGLADKPGIQGELEAVVSASHLEDYLDSLGVNLKLMMISTGVIDNIERPVQYLQVAGLTQKKLNNKYFDRP
jgi:hypothetical protein